MRASRLLAILILLQLRTRLTAETLAEEFEVSVRTIYRDIDELSAAGVPVYGDRGPGGGFQLLDGYRTHLTGLDSSETEAMGLIGLAEPAAALGLGEASARARGKLLAALPVSSLDVAGRIGARFHLDTVDWYRTAESTPHLPALARAALDQRSIAMKYESWTATRDWEIDPLGVVLKAGVWYVIGMAKAKLRTFRVSKIQTLSISDASFAYPSDFNLAQHWRTELDRFESGLRPLKASLSVSPLGLKRITEKGAYAARAVTQAAAAGKDGWAQIELPIETIEQAALLLLSIGPEFDVLAPAELARAIHNIAQSIAINLKW